MGKKLVKCGAFRMYRLMLVDDESEIREGLLEVVNFEECGFTVVGDAANGFEALQRSEELNPDIIITDIRMPLMDGLTMCRHVIKRLPSVNFIVLSGYDDFEYARRAINIKVLDYVLKPISSEEFIEVLKSAKEKLDREFALRRDISRLRRLFEESLPLRREHLLCSLLLGGISAQQAIETAKTLTLSLEADQYMIALAKTLPTAKAPGIGDGNLLDVAISNMFNELIESAHIFHFNGAQAILFLFSEEEDAPGKAVEIMDSARRHIAHFFQVPIGVGISAATVSLAGLEGCAKQAVSALEKSMMLGAEQTVLITDIEPGNRNNQAADERLLRDLENALKICDENRAREALCDLMANFEQMKLSPNGARIYLLEMLMVFLRVSRDLSLGIDLMEIHPKKSLLGRLMEYPSPVQARDEFFLLCKKMLGMIDKANITTGQILSQKAMDYIQEHFSDKDISIECLCQHLYISPSYFSAIFKRETHTTFHQVLNQMRMDKAMQLLTTTEWKSSRVAEEIGLPDPSYFSYAFKRHFGVSPSQVRNRKG